MLEKIFASKTRLKLLQIFLSHSTNKYYQRQLEKLLDMNIRSLQVELDNLFEADFLKKERDGNRVYYFVNGKFPLLKELRILVLKGTFLSDELKFLLADNKRVQLSFIYGSAAKGDLMEGSDLDLFIVGGEMPHKLHTTIKEAEKNFARTINYVIYDAKELRKRAKEGAGFITEVLNSNKIYIKGSEDELRKILKREKAGGV